MTTEEIKEALQTGRFQMLGTREKDGPEFFVITSEDKKYLDGPVYSVNWESEFLTEHNEIHERFFAKPKRRVFPYQKHREFMELTREGFDRFFELAFRHFDDIFSKLPESKRDEFFTRNPHTN